MEKLKEIKDCSSKYEFSSVYLIFNTDYKKGNNNINHAMAVKNALKVNISDSLKECESKEDLECLVKKELSAMIDKDVVKRSIAGNILDIELIAEFKQEFDSYHAGIKFDKKGNIVD